jgi:hypothetical protein
MKTFSLLIILSTVFFYSFAYSKSELKLMSSRTEGNNKISNYLLIESNSQSLQTSIHGPKDRQYVGLDGKILYSDDYGQNWFKKNVEISIQCDAISLYPNPVHESLTISINGDATTKREIKIFDLSGRLVFNKSVDFSAETSFDLSFLPNGCYVMTVSGFERFNNFIKK